MKSKFVIIFAILIVPVVSCKEKKADVNKMSDTGITNGIKLSKAQMQLANIKVGIVSMNNIGNEIIFSGKVVENENTTKQISSKIAGRIDKLFFKTTGDEIKKGEAIYSFYSEDLIAAQKEYILSIEKQSKPGNIKNNFTAYIESAKNKLSLYGLTESQILEIKKSGKVYDHISILSPYTGYIRSINANEGNYIMEGTPIFELADYSSLWIEAQAYSDEMGLIKDQDPVTCVISAFPDEELRSNITFINPELEQKTKINLIRIEIVNPSDKYKPGMMAEVKLKTNVKKVLTVPANAVITDAMGSSVWIQDSTGHFNIRMVTIGVRNSDKVEIISGLKENDKVVISGAYLLNSEYILKHGSDPMAGIKM